jgi:RNA polymerase sigma-70 factor (ECF subfamily)
LTSDWEWLDRALSGDQDAWRRLVERHATRLTRTAFLITGSSAVAQDLVQESFIEIYRRAPVHRNGSLGAYLSTTVYHLALKEKKRSGRMVPIDRFDPDSLDESPLVDVLKGERDRAVTRAIRSLDSGHRDILILRFYGGHSYPEIARMTGLPLGTVKSRIFYAVKSCRKRLKEKGWLDA